jgi:hypothetical protein
MSETLAQVQGIAISDSCRSICYVKMDFVTKRTKGVTMLSVKDCWIAEGGDSEKALEQ